MITPAHSRAIGQVLDATGAPLGTGFLVAIEGGVGKVLTARHVVANRANVQVRFDKAGGQILTATAVKLGVQCDCAVLSGAAPDGVRPLALHQPPNTTDAVTWRTVGYPRLIGFTRGGFGGAVRVVDREELDLHCVELPAGTARNMGDGLSGAPCLIDGAVVGVITDVLRVGQGIATGTVVALSSKSIAAEAGLVLGDGTALPWEGIFTGIVDGWSKGLQREAARIALLDEAESYSPITIARRMINDGIETTAKVLDGLARTDAEKELLLGLASMLWVPGEAAMHLDEAIGENRPALLTTEADWSAEHHLLRAFACRNAGAPIWKCVHIGAIYRDVADVIDDVEAQLGDRLEISINLVSKAVTARRPVTVFLYGPPRDDLTAALKQRWRDVRVVYLTAASVSPGAAPTVQLITPPPDHAQESKASEDMEIWYRKPTAASKGVER